jgi:hypothetical protein
MSSTQLYNPLEFWFNHNLRLAIPHVAIPYDVNYKFDLPAINQLLLGKAVNIVYYRWKCILARRRLCRLRVGNEIEVLPLIGIKYYEAMDNFVGGGNIN